MDFNGKQRNPKDPLLSAGLLPEQTRVLIERFGMAAHGFNGDHVINAGFAMVESVLRQVYPTSSGAAEAFDKFYAEAKERFLREHYLPNGKRRAGLFPFPQNVDVPLLVQDKDKVFRAVGR